MSIRPVAFVTVAALAAATAASVFAAATAATTIATVAYAILGITAGGLSIASITAWIDRTSVDTDSYFTNLRNHAAIALAGTYQFVAQVMLQALVQGAADGVSKAISRKIAGPDVTVQQQRAS